MINFFNWLETEYLDKIPAWVFMLLGLVGGLYLVWRFLYNKMYCPYCGARIVLAEVNEHYQFDRWQCSNPACGWEKVQEFN